MELSTSTIEALPQNYAEQVMLCLLVFIPHISSEDCSDHFVLFITSYSRHILSLFMVSIYGLVYDVSEVVFLCINESMTSLSHICHFHKFPY